MTDNERIKEFRRQLRNVKARFVRLTGVDGYSEMRRRGLLVVIETLESGIKMYRGFRSQP